MGIFSTKQEYRCVEVFYKIDDKLYRFRRGKYIGKGDKELSPTEFFNAYGLDVCEFDIAEGDFACWDATYHYSLNDDFHYDMSKAVEIRKEDLEDAISQLESDFQKKFNDFELNNTLYTYNKYYDYAFPPVVKVRKKLINYKGEDITRQFLLEIEVLDGREGVTKREFITFYDFLNDYSEGCPVKVLDSNGEYENSIDDYFW